MTPRISAPAAVCTVAGLFTLGALLRTPSPTPDAAVVASTGDAGSLVIADFAFGKVTARPGAAVTVVNRDGERHTVSAPDRAFDVRIDRGRSATFTAPRRPGTYTFVCAIHPSMRGRLVVA